MRHKNINHVVHERLREVIRPSDIIVDATCGQGFDTLFCLEQQAQVIGFDVQHEALEKTQLRCQDFTALTLIHDSHEHVRKYIDSFQGIIFNLGYLPSSDKSIITTSHSTLKAFEAAFSCLPVHGWICVTFYQGHEGGEEETHLGIEWMRKHLTIIHEYTYEGINKAPIALFGQKNRHDA